eukprot:864179-Rhodomonas_salina.1
MEGKEEPVELRGGSDWLRRASTKLDSWMEEEGSGPGSSIPASQSAFVSSSAEQEEIEEDV